MAILRSDHSALNQATWPSPLCDQVQEIFWCQSKHLSIDDHWAKDGCHQLKGASVRGNWKFVHFAPKNHPKQVAPPMSYWVDLKKFSLASGLYLASPGPIKVGFAWRFHFAWPPIGWLTQSRSVKKNRGLLNKVAGASWLDFAKVTRAYPEVFNKLPLNHFSCYIFFNLFP